jgi:hypothetical protein
VPPDVAMAACDARMNSPAIGRDTTSSCSGYGPVFSILKRVMTVQRVSRNQECRWVQVHQALTCPRAASAVRINSFKKMSMLGVASTT